MHPEEPIANDPTLFEIPTGRRRVLSTLGFSSAALLLSQTPAAAFIAKNNRNEPRVTIQPASAPQPRVDLSRFPAEWVRQQGGNLPGYVQYIDSLRLRTIRTEDVVAAHSRQRGGVWNTIPPRQWWPRMGYTLRVVERVALEMNEPVTEILSAYRSPAYNARCGGKRGSWHQANLALDVRLVSRPSRVTAVTRNLRDQGMFRGGVGNYRNFTHVDARGENINW